MAEHHDERLGTLLRELEVPEHGPEFWAELERLLADEAPAGAAPELPDRRFPIAQPGRRRRRRSIAEPPAGLRLRPRLGFGLAAAAVIAIVAVVVIRSATLTTAPASAAEIIGRALEAIGSVESLSGTLRLETNEDERPGDRNYVDSWRFAIDDDGSFRLIQELRRGREEYTLDGRSGVAHDLSVPPPRAPFGGAFALRQEGVPLGGPDPGGPPDILRRDIGASVLSLLEADATRVTEATFDDRAAYRLDTPVNNFGSQDSHVRALIDRDSGIPVQITITAEGGFRSEFSLRDLQFDGPPPAEGYTLDFPLGVPRQDDDLGFRRTELETAVRRAGYEPPTPASVPEGFELAEVAVRVPTPAQSCIDPCDPATFPIPTGISATNPVAGPIIALAYRDGLRQFTVTARPTGPRPELWEDPFIFGIETSSPVDRLRLGSGALAGARAEVVTGPDTQPHIWALGEELVVTVDGSLSRGELIAVAESLRR